MAFLECLNSPQLDFTQTQSGGKIIKFQQSQPLTSHFESFWSIVLFHTICKNSYLKWRAFGVNLTGNNAIEKCSRGPRVLVQQQDWIVVALVAVFDVAYMPNERLQQQYMTSAWVEPSSWPGIGQCWRWH